MNVYDFDGTIYSSDSTIDFYRFCIGRFPYLIKYLPRQIQAYFRYKCRKIDSTLMKSEFFRFLEEVRDLDIVVQEFWDKNETKICKWYLKIKKSDDLIISASPSFLILPICQRLNIREPIATNIDMKTGQLIGNNCKGVEKLKRFYECYPDESICTFYSDSYSDQSLANIAQNSFIVHNGRISEWKR